MENIKDKINKNIIEINIAEDGNATIKGYTTKKNLKAQFQRLKGLE